MKKVIPVIIAIVLLIIIGYMSFGKKIVDRYSYGTERADLNDYFKIYSSSDIPIILQDARIDVYAHKIDGVIYFDQSMIEDYFTERFYVDTNENLLLYTMSDSTVSAELGGNTYTKDGETFTESYTTCLVKDDTLYIAADYLKKFVNFSYEVFSEPDHMQLYTEWGRKTVADIKADTQVRWLAGVKSAILTDVAKDDVVEVLEVMDTWTKVKTKDSFIGYVENSKLTNERFEDETPVKDAFSDELICLVRDHKINLTWHNIEFPQDGADLKQALANTRSVNVVSPTWYRLSDNDGNFKNVANANYVDYAHSRGIEVWPLVSNLDYKVDLYEILAYTSKRNKLVTELVADAVSRCADGINLDFENVPVAVSTHYVQFVRELGVECHKYNLVLSVDNYVPTEYTAHYNRHEQAKFADYIIIMGYDEHYVGSDAGSVSSIPWMEKGIKDTINYVPARQVINAIPFYTRVWTTKGNQVTSQAVTMEVSQNFLTKNKIKPVYDDATKQNYGEVTIGKELWQVWLEDADSIKIRLNVMQAAGIAGVASWKLGQETPDIWTVIEAYMNE
ncbi:MAG: chitinase [Lachnospiraceae bacterium]|nr:chitinase [Lachnospiraceae bacterium]